MMGRIVSKWGWSPLNAKVRAEAPRGMAAKLNGPQSFYSTSEELAREYHYSRKRLLEVLRKYDVGHMWQSNSGKGGRHMLFSRAEAAEAIMKHREGGKA